MYCLDTRTTRRQHQQEILITLERQKAKEPTTVAAQGLVEMFGRSHDWVCLRWFDSVESIIRNMPLFYFTVTIPS